MLHPHVNIVGMLPTSAGALVIILLAIAPGFIASTAWARPRTWKGPEGDLRMILRSLVISAVIQALLAPLTVAWIVHNRSSLPQHAYLVTAWVLLAVVVVPVFVGLVAGWLTDRVFPPSDDRVKGRIQSRVHKVARISVAPSIWDWMFEVHPPPESSFIVVEFNDGSRVGGAFAGASNAITSPEVHGLFLEQEWIVNDRGDIELALPGSAGVLIPTADDVRLVRILVPEKTSVGGEESSE